MAATTIRVKTLGLRFFIVLATLCLLAAARDVGAQTPVEAGFRDFSYGTTPTVSPSGERPQSKLWWTDGSWWGCLFNATAASYHIYRLDPVTHGWTDTGVAVDDRPQTKADTLWNESTGKLYIASNYFSSFPAESTSPSHWARLYRYSYLPAQDQYVLDTGFPVTITKGSAEALTIARDTAGRLWVTWVESGVVKISYSLSNDLDWSLPTDLPVGAAGTTSSDDISAVVAFGGNQVGVMWSNQITRMTHFAVHRDVDLPTVWQPVEAVMPGCTGACSDDHISLKSDSAGRAIAVLKTSLLKVGDPLIVLAVRDILGVWTNYTVGLKQDDHTRPIVLLAEENNRVFVFATQPEGGGSIYYKESPLDSIAFAPGPGALFIDSSGDPTINNVTSTKGNVTQASGIVALASDSSTQRYLHNEMALSAVAVTSFSPSSGRPGTQVTIVGQGLSGAFEVRFNQTVALFIVISDQEIRASVPRAATTGPISVTTPNGTAESSGNFVVLSADAIPSFSPSNGAVGTPVLLSGRGFWGATDVTFNGTAAAFSVLSDTLISTSVPAGSTTGRIAVTNRAGTSTSATDFVVRPGGKPH